MRSLLLAVAMLAIGFAASGQSAPPRQSVVFRAIKVTTLGDGVQLRGNVEVQLGDVIVYADEADMMGDFGKPMDFTLRGNVHLKVPDSKP